MSGVCAAHDVAELLKNDRGKKNRRVKVQTSDFNETKYISICYLAIHKPDTLSFIS